MTFQERIALAFQQENERRQDAGHPRLSKTDLWKAARASSGAASHWFNGTNGADLATCMKIAPLLKVSPNWLYDESAPMRPGSASPDEASPSAPPWPFSDISLDEYQSLSTYDKKMVENLIRSMLEEKRKNPRPSASKSRSEAMEKGRQRAAARRHGELQHVPKK